MGREIVLVWVLSDVVVESRVGSAAAVGVTAAGSVAVVVLLRCERPGCGTEVVAAKVVAALDMARRQGRRVVVCSLEGVAAAEPAVESGVMRRHVGWIVAWRRVR